MLARLETSFLLSFLSSFLCFKVILKGTTPLYNGLTEIIFFENLIKAEKASTRFLQGIFKYYGCAEGAFTRTVTARWREVAFYELQYRVIRLVCQ